MVLTTYLWSLSIWQYWSIKVVSKIQSRDGYTMMQTRLYDLCKL